MSVDATKTNAVPQEPEQEVVSLRAATAADADALALIGAATFLEAFTWMLPGADIVAHCAKHHTAASYAKYLAMPKTRITLAVTGADVPVGFAMIVAPELPDFDLQSGDIELKRIYLFSRFRRPETPLAGRPGVRVAAALMEQAMVDAKALGGTRLLLGVNDGNERALRFYRRSGFDVVGTRTFQVGSQLCSDLLFGKAL